MFLIIWTDFIESSFGIGEEWGIKEWGINFGTGGANLDQNGTQNKAKQYKIGTQIDQVEPSNPTIYPPLVLTPTLPPARLTRSEEKTVLTGITVALSKRLAQRFISEL